MHIPQYFYHPDYNLQLAVALMMQDQKDVAITKLGETHNV